MAFENILVLDDEILVRKSLQEALRAKRYRVQTASNLSEAEQLMVNGQYDVVFCDLGLPDGSGMDLLERHAGLPEAPVFIMISGHNSVELAVQCMRLGAFDYVIKPFDSDQVHVVLEKAEKFDQLVEINQYYSKGASEDSRCFLGESPPMLAIKQLIERVARTDATVLIHGETGTGKEMIANELFRLSRRSNGPFIKVNCASVSETLIESEFFGHEKGAFTGALQRRKGRFELADTGTLLLDEISEISLGLQAKLLRVLQEKEFERVGGQSTIKVDVRVIATTNRDLCKSVEKGEFREDLYYRLNVFPLHSAPLRERRSDIPILVDHFLGLFARKHGIHPKGFTQEAMDALMRHDWPGNVRELQNTVEYAVIMTPDSERITPHCFSFATATRPGSRPSDTPSAGSAVATENVAPAGVCPSSDGAPLTLDELERQHIHEILLTTGGNRTKAATILNVSVRTLRNKLKLYRENGYSEFSAFD